MSGNSAAGSAGVEQVSAAAMEVAIVIPCYRQAHFLPRAIESALGQSVPPAEIIVVDDGSDDGTSEVAGRFGQVRLLRQANAGLAAARNAGLRAASSSKIIFLDADDALLPNAVSAGLACFRDNPEAAFVHGGFRTIRGAASSERFTPAMDRCDLIRCNWVAMIATVLFDRSKLVEVGGFDRSLGMCEDWDLYLRLSRRYPFAAHEQIVACYFKHGDNMSDDVGELKRWIEAVREKERFRGLSAEEEAAWHEGREVWRSFYPDPSPAPLIRRLLRRSMGLLRRALRADAAR